MGEPRLPAAAEPTEDSGAAAPTTTPPDAVGDIAGDVRAQVGHEDSAGREDAEPVGEATEFLALVKSLEIGTDKDDSRKRAYSIQRALLFAFEQNRIPRSHEYALAKLFIERALDEDYIGEEEISRSPAGSRKLGMIPEYYEKWVTILEAFRKRYGVQDKAKVFETGCQKIAADIKLNFKDEYIDDEVLWRLKQYVREIELLKKIGGDVQFCRDALAKAVKVFVTQNVRRDSTNIAEVAAFAAEYDVEIPSKEEMWQRDLQKALDDVDRALEAARAKAESKDFPRSDLEKTVQQAWELFEKARHETPPVKVTLPDGAKNEWEIRGWLEERQDEVLRINIRYLLLQRKADFLEKLAAKEYKKLGGEYAFGALHRAAVDARDKKIGAEGIAALSEAALAVEAEIRRLAEAFSTIPTESMTDKANEIKLLADLKRDMDMHTRSLER